MSVRRGGPARQWYGARALLSSVAAMLALSLTGACSAGSSSAAGSDSTAEPAVPGAGDGCLTSSDHARQVHFGTRQELGGYVLGGGPRWVVLGHQSDGTSCQMLPIARGLAEAGFQVLAIDFSGTGSSQVSDSATRTLADDMVDAVGFVHREGATRVAVLGASMGGYASLGAAKELGSTVQAIVSLSAPAYYTDGGRPPDLRGVATPVLLYVGRGDIAFLGPNQHYAKVDKRAELHVLPSSRHGVDLVDAHAFGRIVDFLNTQLST